MVDEPRRPVWKTTRTTRDNARRLRREMTDAERAVWKHLRAHRLNSNGFRRQKPIGPYIVDFVCEAARLIVEIDGGQHYQDAGLALDKKRDAFLKSLGYSVMRFDNMEVLTNTTGVLESILLSLKTKLPLPASPASGGGEEDKDAS